MKIRVSNEKEAYTMEIDVTQKQLDKFESSLKDLMSDIFPNLKYFTRNAIRYGQTYDDYLRGQKLMKEIDEYNLQNT